MKAADFLDACTRDFKFEWTSAENANGRRPGKDNLPTFMIPGIGTSYRYIVPSTIQHFVLYYTVVREVMDKGIPESRLRIPRTVYR
jgi:hypothetical protein